MKNPANDSVRAGKIREAVFDLVRHASTELPADVVKALQEAHAAEAPDSNAQMTLSLFLENLRMAKERNAPACQDTGMPLFFIKHPAGTEKGMLTDIIHKVLAQATGEQLLRPNAVDPVSGKNSGINVGTGFPGIYYSEWDDAGTEISLILKGGGSENVGRQYSLPYGELDAGRDIEGVRRVALDAVIKAEGKGCPPGVLGICIGGDRGSGYVESKRQFLRLLDDVNPNQVLARLEARILREANELGIGPLGLGGRTTLLGVKIGALHRLPACYFVSISYMCWQFRRRVLRLKPDGSYTIT